MSMDTYAATEVGFLVDEEVLAYVCLSADRKDGSVPGSITDLIKAGTFNLQAKKGKLPDSYSDLFLANEYLEDEAQMRYLSSFDGEVSTLLPEKTSQPINRDFNDDYLVYISPEKSSTLFQAAYASPDELLAEFQAVFSNAGVTFPADFDWWAHIVSIEGTYFC